MPPVQDGPQHSELLDALPSPVVVLDDAGRVVSVSAAWRRLAGGTAADPVGLTLAELFDLVGLAGPAGHDTVDRAVSAVLSGSVPEFSTELRWSKATTERWFLTQGAGLAGGRGGAVICLADVTDLKRAEAELAHHASHDPLTGLPNRAALIERLSAAVGPRSRAGSVALLFLDLDGFTRINEAYGHTAGDALLVELAGRLARVVRTEDLLARFTGDEFVVLCEDLLGEVHAVGLADRLLSALAEPFTVQGEDVTVTASIGIALASDEPLAPERLLRDADAAMTEAKSLGRSRHQLFDRALRGRARRQLATTQALRRGLEQGELVVHYQPVLALRSGLPRGVEALVRWQRPGAGLAQPDEFLALAEESGLVLELGRQVLDAACQAAVRWHLPADRLDESARGGLAVAVNVSARQLGPPLVDEVRSALDRSGLDPGRLVLEVTESAVLGGHGRPAEALRALRGIGVRVAVDDFGTGYASLSHLKELPVDVLKVDRSFVAGLPHAAEDRQIVRAIVGLAHALGLQVTAEGIERADQLTLLGKLRCDAGQGLLWSPALPEDALLDWLAGVGGIRRSPVKSG